MTDINRLLNTTSAGLLAQKLDEIDGTKDGKISGSIWNQFVEANKTGKKISEQGSISTANAMNSITTYVVKKMNAENKTEAEIVASFNENADNLKSTAQPNSTDSTAQTQQTQQTQTQQTQQAEQTPPTDTTPPAATASQVKTENKQTQAQTDYKNVKVTVPSQGASAEVKDIVKNREAGLALADAFKQGLAKKNAGQVLDNASWKALNGITSKNVAYALPDWVGIYSPNGRKFATEYFNLLVERMKELGIFKEGQDKEHLLTYSYKSLSKSIWSYRNRIIQKENEIIKADNAARNKYNNEVRPKAQKVFDDANKFLAEVANMNPKPELKSGHDDEDNYDWKHAVLPDGRWIGVRYDDKGEIFNIKISHDTTPEHNEDGSTFDGAEVSYTKDVAKYDTDKSNGDFEGNITSGYNFEKLKALAKKIFG